MSDSHNDKFIARLIQGIDSLRHKWVISNEASIELLTLSENATFLVTEPKKDDKLIVRVHRANYHSIEEISSEITWILNIRDTGKVKTPAPIATDSGEYIAQFQDNQDTRYVVAFEYMEGQAPSSENDLEDGFKTLGKISAELHNHASEWQIPADFTRKYWTFDTTLGERPIWGDWRESIDLDIEGKQVLEHLCIDLEQKLNVYDQNSDRFGLIHADLRLANLLMNKDSLSVIDFDDCGFSWFMYDFATAISFYEDSPQIPKLLAAWLEGYRSVRELDIEHEAMIPTFIVFRRLLLTAWIASHAETETALEAGLGAYTKGTIEIADKYLKGQYL